MTKSAEAFRTISEVAEWLGVQTHVLRFWESKFTQVKPVKRAGGRRYYRPADMLLLGGIRKLLHDDGMTIKGVQKILRERGVAFVADKSGPLDVDVAAAIDADLAKTPAPSEVEIVPKPEPAPLEANATEAAGQDAAPVHAESRESLTDSDTSPVFDAPTQDPALEGVEALMASTDSQTDETPAPTDVESVEPGPSMFENLNTGAPEAPQSMLSDFDPMPEPNASTDMSESAPPEIAETPTPEWTSTRSEPEAPLRPRIVDVPPDPDLESIAARPSVLSQLRHAGGLTPEQASILRPLLAQLTALRDQMAQARRDSH